MKVLDVVVVNAAVRTHSYDSMVYEKGHLGGKEKNLIGNEKYKK